MSVYDKSGTALSAVYDKTGTSLPTAYDKDGVVVFTSGPEPDYDEWSTEYQHTILQARDDWKTEYRADNTSVPLMFHTDQHRYLKYAGDTFQYLAQAIKWPELSAIVNLGDVCGATYSESDLNYMVSCLSPIPTAKKIGVWGNHDCEHSSSGTYSYVALTDAEFTILKNTYFDNSGYGDGTYHCYDNRNNEYIVDNAHGIKFCVLSTWYWNDEGQVYYDPRLSYEAAEAWIAMLSAVDDYDIIVLSHIQPYYYTEWYHPAVDGEEAEVLSVTADRISKVSPFTQINQLMAARKAKTSGTLIDYDGVSHSYDFSACTSDILCCFAGHRHQDLYQWDSNGTVPVIVLDAMGYDNHPIYMVNVDRTGQKVDVWKVDDSPTFYRYSVPFTKPVSS